MLYPTVCLPLFHLINIVEYHGSQRINISEFYCVTLMHMDIVSHPLHVCPHEHFYSAF
jgi:hypothetical protein